MTDSAPITIDLWTDIVCPWCYLGSHRLTRAIAARDDAERFVVNVRSFELHPDAPTQPEPLAAYFSRAMDGDASSFRRMEAQIEDLATADGLPFSNTRQSANTLAVHRVTQLARTEGVADQLFTRLQDGYFAGTLNPFDDGELITAAASVGLDPDRVRAVLADDEFADAVEADVREALSLGARGVPFLRIGPRLAVAGAQPVEQYAALLARVAG